MTARSLREAFTLLLREAEAPRPALSGAAEAAIRKRVVARWLTRVVAAAALCGIGAIAVAGSHEPTKVAAVVTPSQVPAPSASVAAATFPLAGGPEFEPAASSFACGDHAPATHPAAQGVALTIDATVAGATPAGAPAAGQADWPTVRGRLSPGSDLNIGVLATSGIDFLILDRGIVVGTLAAGSIGLGWRPETGDRLASQAPLVTDTVTCGADDASPIAAGTYTIVAVARVFSNPEAVALSQTLTNPFLTDGLDPTLGARNPRAIYLPGSFDCGAAMYTGKPPRGCLPDLTDKAVVDADAGTVTVLYDTSDLVTAFDVTLVSAPLTVTLVEDPRFADPASFDWGLPRLFSSAGDLACGASGLVNDPAAPAEAVIDDVVDAAPRTLAAGGTFGGQVMAWDAADGTRVELLPGAVIAYLNPTETAFESRGLSLDAQVDTVIAVAPITSVGAVTTDRFAGPRGTTFTVAPATPCQGVDPVNAYPFAHGVIAGQWRLTAPDGAVTTLSNVGRIDAGDGRYWVSSP